ncbi:hypothetical protein AB0B79_36190 [Streptomyces sp. NPDC039022]|uniref:hypothetical protein n=1 Tax=unclassified Streptomyces TaxID=2593676 RepID=UPI0034036272
MSIDPQRALEGYLRALSYDPYEAEPKSESKSEPKSESGSGAESAPRKTPVPAPATEPAPAATAGPGLLGRLLSLRRGPATAEGTRRA